jgi:hypothetical protein
MLGWFYASVLLPSLFVCSILAQAQAPASPRVPLARTDSTAPITVALILVINAMSEHVVPKDSRGNTFDV